MKNTKGKRGFIPLQDLFSYFAYFLMFFTFVILLNFLPSCLIDKDKAESSIQSRVDAVAASKADVQLTAYLRTHMPTRTELYGKLDWLRQKELFGSDDVKDAKELLEEYPELLDSDYASFIRGLYSVHSSDSGSQENVKAAFKAVTGAMFVQGVSDNREKGGFWFYVLPLGVDFDTSDPAYDLFVQNLPYKFVSQRSFAKAVQPLPLPDGKTAIIELRHYSEFRSWLPGP